MLVLSVAFCGVRNVIERGADFAGKRPRMRGRHHALPVPGKQRLTKPVLKNRDLPTDRTVGQVQFARCSPATWRIGLMAFCIGASRRQATPDCWFVGRYSAFGSGGWFDERATIRTCITQLEALYHRLCHRFSERSTLRFSRLDTGTFSRHRKELRLIEAWRDEYL